MQGRKDRTRLASLQLLRSEIEGILYVLGFSVPSYTEVLNISPIFFPFVVLKVIGLFIFWGARN